LERGTGGGCAADAGGFAGGHEHGGDSRAFAVRGLSGGGQCADGEPGGVVGRGGHGRHGDAGAAAGWTIDGGYYRVPVSVSMPLVLSNLTAGAHMVSVLGEVAGIYQPTGNATTAGWTVNPLYGYDLSALPAVRSLAYTNVGTGAVTFNWDSTSDSGMLQPAGWYTARIADGFAGGHKFCGGADAGGGAGGRFDGAGRLQGANERLNGR